MNMREKIANWLTFGSYKQGCDAWWELHELKSREQSLWHETVVDFTTALSEITKLDTPKASHGVKKAVRIAREALDKSLGG